MSVNRNIMIRNTLFAAVCASSLTAAAQSGAPQDSLSLLRHDVIVVTGTRNATLSHQLPATITSVSHQQLTANYQTSVLPTLMDLTPGLYATSRGIIGYGISTNSAGSMKIRGVGDNSNLLVVIDGQPQYAGLMGHPVPDAYMSMMAEKIEVLRGPASVIYGSNAMGGVINIITKNANEDGYKGEINLNAGSYGTLTAETTNRIRHGRSSAVVNLNYQRTDGHRPQSDFEQATAFVKYGYELSDKWEMHADADVTNFNFRNPGSVESPLLDFRGKITRGLASLSVSNSYGNTDGTFRAFYDWGHHNIDDGHAPDSEPTDYYYKHNDHIAGITAFQNVRILTGNNITFGFDYQNFGGAAWNESKIDGTHQADYTAEDQNEIAGYIDIRQGITGLVTLDFGLRIDHHSQVGTEIVPQGGVVIHFPKTQDVKLLVSKGFANPVIKDLYMFPPHNGQLEPERMLNYEIAYTKRGTNGSFGFNLFYVDGKNKIEAHKPPLVPKPIYLNTGSFQNFGFEIEGNYTFGRWWTLNANYSYLHLKKPIAGAPEGKLYAGATYKHGRWTANASIENISGLYLATDDNPCIENYTLANVTAGCQLCPPILAYIRAENIMAERYQTYAGFPMPKATFMAGVKITIKD